MVTARGRGEDEMRGLVVAAAAVEDIAAGVSSD
jgi:hypothetical protein